MLALPDIPTDLDVAMAGRQHIGHVAWLDNGFREFGACLLDESQLETGKSLIVVSWLVLAGDLYEPAKRGVVAF